jgi:hypothetical protein
MAREFLDRAARILSTTFAFCGYMPGAEERRRAERRDRDRRDGERRDGDRRGRPGDVDVTRVEHENLSTQVMQNAHDIRRLEAEVRRLRAEVDAIRFKAAS